LGCASIGAVLVRVRQPCSRNGTLQLVDIDSVARVGEVPNTLQDKLRTLVFVLSIVGRMILPPANGYTRSSSRKAMSYRVHSSPTERTNSCW
jgi:hypothetical protein